PRGRTPVRSPTFSPTARSVLPRAGRKVAECGRGNGLDGRHRAKSQSEPTLSVQGTPQILPSHGPAHRRADGSRLFVALAVDWFKSDGENGKVGDAPKLTKWSRGPGQRPGRNVSRSRPPFSHRPAAAALIELPPPPPDARELARQLNHLPASATNE